MNNAMKLLYDEHEIIVNSIEIVNQAGSLIDKDNELYEEVIIGLLDFFKTYADQYHHHKEEEILFPEMAKRNEMIADGLIKEMLDNHSDFREMIAKIKNNLDDKNYSEVQKLLKIYTENLLDHIAVENEELFQIADSLFNEKELNDIYFRFLDCDRELGESKKEKLVETMNSLRKKLLFAV